MSSEGSTGSTIQTTTMKTGWAGMVTESGQGCVSGDTTLFHSICYIHGCPTLKTVKVATLNASAILHVPPLSPTAHNVPTYTTTPLIRPVARCDRDVTERAHPSPLLAAASHHRLIFIATYLDSVSHIVEVRP